MSTVILLTLLLMTAVMISNHQLSTLLHFQLGSVWQIMVISISILVFSAVYLTLMNAEREEGANAAFAFAFSAVALSLLCNDNNCKLL